MVSTVEITLWTGLHIRKADVDADTLDVIRESWTYPNPSYDLDQRLRKKEMEDYEKAKAEGRTMQVQFAFREAPSETIQCYDEDDDWIVVPRGTGTKLLRNILTERGFTPHVTDKREQGLQIDVRRSEGWEPYHYQDQACVALYRAQRGYVKADTAAGKTVIGIEFIARTGRVALCIAHTGEILDGWYDEIMGNEEEGTSPKLAGDFTVTRLQGKKGAMAAARGDIILATIQTLYRLPQEVLDVLNERVGLVLNDETHHAPAETFWAALSKLAAKRRHGLTATDKRKDKKDFLLTEVIGPCVYEISDKLLAQSGKVRIPTVDFIPLDFYPTVEKRNRHGKVVVDPVASREIAESSYNRVRLLNMMAASEARNNAIADQIEADWKAGHICGAITERVKHCTLLADILRERGMVVAILKGGPKSKAAAKARRKIKIGVADGSIDVVVGTQVFDEGVNFPRLSAMHFLLPGNNEARTKQRAGRARRPEGHDDSLVRDYVDYRCGGVIRSYQNRRRWYRKWKWPVNDISLSALLS